MKVAIITDDPLRARGGKHASIIAYFEELGAEIVVVNTSEGLEGKPRMPELFYFDEVQKMQPLCHIPKLNAPKGPRKGWWLK